MLGWLSIAAMAFMLLVNLPWHKPGCQIVVGERARIAQQLHAPEHFDDWPGENDVLHRVCGGVTKARAWELFDLTHREPTR